MKELSIEEKAKRYDKAIERVKNYYSTTDSASDIKLIGLIFPELKESDNKRMIQYFKDLAPFDKADELYEKYGFSHKDALAWLEKQGKQKPAEFDDTNAKRMFIKALEMVEEQNNKGYKLTDCDKNSWWEDFKAYTSCTIEQKPYAWSEEDELITNKILCICSDFERSFKISPASTKVIKEDVDKIDNWLKSLKDRFTWKPSDEQMNALNYVVNLMASSERPTENDLYYNILKSLRQQLKKHYL